MIDKRAITPEQKKEVLDSILKVWLDNPELRLGQLIRNSSKVVKLYYEEDYDLVRNIQIFGEINKS